MAKTRGPYTLLTDAGVQWDEKGKPFYYTSNGGRDYIPPVFAASHWDDPKLLAWAKQQGVYFPRDEQGMVIEDESYNKARPGQSLLKNAGTWNSQKGKFDQGANWTNILAMGTGAMIAAPFVAGALGAGAVGSGAAGSSAGAGSAGAAGGTLASSSIPAAALMGGPAGIASGGASAGVGLGAGLGATAPLASQGALAASAAPASTAPLASSPLATTSSTPGAVTSQGASQGASGMGGWKGALGKIFGGQNPKIDPLMAILGIGSMFGGDDKDDPLAKLKYFEKPGELYDPRESLHRALAATLRMGQGLTERGPVRLRTTFAPPPAPISVPGIGFQIGGGLASDPALKDPSLLEFSRGDPYKYDPFQSVPRAGITEMRQNQTKIREPK